MYQANDFFWYGRGEDKKTPGNTSSAGDTTSIIPPQRVLRTTRSVRYVGSRRHLVPTLYSSPEAKSRSVLRGEVRSERPGGVEARGVCQPAHGQTSCILSVWVRLGTRIPGHSSHKCPERRRKECKISSKCFSSNVCQAKGSSTAHLVAT